MSKSKSGGPTSWLSGEANVSLLKGSIQQDAWQKLTQEEEPDKARSNKYRIDFGALTSSSSSSASSASGSGEFAPTTWSAWWVLLWYSYISGLQSLLWMTYSSVPDDSRSWLNTDNQTLDLWLDWGPVGYCVSVAGALFLLSSRRDGLRISVRLAAGLCFTASLLRCVPIAMSPATRAANHDAVLAIIHVAQFLNGSVAPLVVASPSYLSLIWFDDNKRNTATAIGNVANAVGRGVGFFLGPAIVASADDLPTLLFLEVGLAALPLLAVLAYYPAAPAEPPSRAAAEESRAMQDKEDDAAMSKESGDGKGPLWTAASTAAGEIWRAVRVPSFVVLAFAGGLEMAVYGLWSGVLPTVLSPRFTDAQAGAFGSVNTFAGIVGGLVAGLVTDVKALRHHLKTVVQVLALLSAGAFAVVAISVPPFEVSAVSDYLGYAGLMGVFAAAGLLRGGTDPLFFELSAEVSHPAGVPAGAAGGVLTFFYHVVLCGFLSTPPDILSRWTMVGMGALMAASAVLLIPLRVAYTRR
jgi:hypothetical protein